jgi:hypothetical protein
LTIFDKESELHFLPKVEGILIDIWNVHCMIYI